MTEPLQSALNEEQRLKRKRGYIKKQLTEFAKFINNKGDELKDKVPSEVDREIVFEIQHRLERVLPILEKFNEYEESIDEAGLAGNEDEAEATAFTNSYFAATAKAKKLIEDCSLIDTDNSIIVKNTSTVGGNSNSFNNNNSNLGTTPKIRFPEIRLPIFNGEFVKWLQFRDTYKILVHDNKELSDIQKFYYLQSALQGDAQKIINCINGAASNYSLAWTTLCDRYENKRLLINNHLRALFNMTNVIKDSASHFRQMLDSINQHLHILKTLDQPTESWDSMVVFLATTKFDSATSREWESFKPITQIPTLDDLKRFLGEKAAILESLNFNKLDIRVSGSINSRETSNKHRRSIAMVSNISCYYCKGNHSIYQCENFLKLNSERRVQEIKRLKLCRNCLRVGHFASECEASGCRKCRLKHNTLLHFERAKSETNTTVENNSSVMASQSFHCLLSNRNFALLPTALLEVKRQGHGFLNFRALLDTGSQSNFLTLNAAKRLGIKINPVHLTVSGINGVVTNIQGQCDIKFKLNNGEYFHLKCLVVPVISEPMPQVNVCTSNLKFPSRIRLADPDFDKSGVIDVLIGVIAHSKLLLRGKMRLGKDEPLLQDTKVGWIVSGPVSSKIVEGYGSICSLIADSTVQEQLEKFWKLEEVPYTKPVTESDKQCEEHFSNTHKRDKDGRFIVSIPWKEKISLLGDSKTGALRRFYSLEKRLENRPEFRKQYVEFMLEYERLGHMTQVESECSGNIEYFIPHHGVLKEERITTKLRVVFDASFPSDSGYSRNDLEHVGPVVQNDLFYILLRFRQYPIAITADVEKMYRQVLVKPEDRALQKIFWRNDPSEPLRIYELNTVTYGTASGSYLSTRCLYQLSEENEIRFSKACDVIKNNFYVDDLLAGSDSLQESIELCKNVDTVLKSGCFVLRKWLSNNPRLLDYLENVDTNKVLKLGPNESTKTLGLGWLSNEDYLCFNINGNLPKKTTKRVVLSTISQIFDPLGLVGVCIVIAKIILQEMWCQNLSWDDKVNSSLRYRWESFRESLPKLNNLKVPRNVLCKDPVKVEIHGFSDASEKAYGACVYVVSCNSDSVISRLLCSKSKVAPIKTMTMPRLELCAALTLAKLVKNVINSFRFKIDEVHLWTDSTVVLGWLSVSGNCMKIFVANRVTKIRDYVPGVVWKHVPTTQNPADLISRGISVEQLLSSNLWFQGPEWLCLESSQWPNHLNLDIMYLPDLREAHVLKVSIVSKFNPMCLFDCERFSKFTRLTRSLGYLLRFIHNCTSPNSKRSGPLTCKELDDALILIIRQVQEESFLEEIISLLEKKNISKKSKLLSLNPFLDDKGILRVGGRLQHSDFDFSFKHPIILPAKHHFTVILFRHEHERLQHVGPQQLLGSIRDRFWPIKGKDMARQIVRKCVKCYHVKPSNNFPLMGSLPGVRVQPSFVFENVGIDYAGPFLIRDRKGRGAKSFKCYLSLFICLSTKAVHFELVSSLTTEAFIDCLKRFIARRGHPRLIFSDNGTNFIGAHRELMRTFHKLEKDDKFAIYLSTERIKWHFIPPNAPHFGGIWESCVKRVKFHLRRIVGTASLTFEELMTVFCQVESILNSRPLLPLSNDPSELEPLTPAHFLIGRKFTALPYPDVTSISFNKLTSFQRVQQLVQHFWKRWVSEYLTSLQPRKKWKFNTQSMSENELVLIKDDTLPPLCWALGRITKLHPGHDGIVRVATVRTQKGLLQRPVVKLYPLPTNSEENISSGDG